MGRKRGLKPNGILPITKPLKKKLTAVPITICSNRDKREEIEREGLEAADNKVTQKRGMGYGVEKLYGRQ
jgi:hypothetical protein